MENSLEAPQKLKIKLPHDLAIPPLEYLSKQNENTNLKATCIPCSLQHYLQPPSYENNLRVFNGPMKEQNGDIRSSLSLPPKRVPCGLSTTSWGYDTGVTISDFTTALAPNSRWGVFVYFSKLKQIKLSLEDFAMLLEVSHCNCAFASGNQPGRWVSRTHQSTSCKIKRKKVSLTLHLGCNTVGTHGRGDGAPWAVQMVKGGRTLCCHLQSGHSPHARASPSSTPILIPVPHPSVLLEACSMLMALSQWSSPQRLKWHNSQRTHAPARVLHGLCTVFQTLKGLT